MTTAMGCTISAPDPTPSAIVDNPRIVVSAVMTMGRSLVLHDTIEDCTGVTEEILRSRFGERVAELVAGESEDKSKTWEERKSTTIRHLKTESRELQMIALADKLSNMRDIDRDYPVLGEGLWMKFRMHSKQAIGWYYKGVMEALREDFQDVPAFQEYCRLVRKHFGDAPASLEWKEEKKRRGGK